MAIVQNYYQETSCRLAGWTYLILIAHSLSNIFRNSKLCSYCVNIDRGLRTPLSSGATNTRCAIENLFIWPQFQSNLNLCQSWQLQSEPFLTNKKVSFSISHQPMMWIWFQSNHIYLLWHQNVIPFSSPQFHLITLRHHIESSNLGQVDAPSTATSIKRHIKC